MRFLENLTAILIKKSHHEHSITCLVGYFYRFSSFQESNTILYTLEQVFL